MIFLDEVGLLPEGLQAKLLKVIEDQTVRRLGGTRAEVVDVWVIAATSVDLLQATQDGRFRQDLFHRLAVVQVTLPPLRTRGPDIVRLAEHFLDRACADYGLSRRALTPDARSALLKYAWPGNVRELANLMERVALLSEDREVRAAVLGLSPRARPVRGAGRPTARADPRRRGPSASGRSSSRPCARRTGTSPPPRPASASLATPSAIACRASGSKPTDRGRRRAGPSHPSSRRVASLRTHASTSGLTGADATCRSSG